MFRQFFVSTVLVVWAFGANADDANTTKISTPSKEVIIIKEVVKEPQVIIVKEESDLYSRKPAPQKSIDPNTLAIIGGTAAVGAIMWGINDYDNHRSYRRRCRRNWCY